MLFRLLAVGKLRDPSIAALCRDFAKRLAPYHRLDLVEVRAAPGDQPQRAIGAEGEALLRAIDPAETVWLLDREGEQLASHELAARLDALALGGTSRLTLVIAGTYGAAPEVVARAQFRWSLSRLTFLHEWARALVLEQLYRAAKIAKDEPYHH